jgi:hypothetical protein
MANRYWVGGTGTWDTSSTANWSTSSGGSSGASVPTASDSVFFDQAGTYTVTLTGSLTCLDFTVSAGTVTFSSTGSPTVSGSMSLIAGTVWSSGGGITFNATTTGKTFTTNGTSISGTIYFSGVGGAWTLGSALSCTSGINFTAGTLDTSNYSVTSSTFQSSGSSVKVLTLGSTTWTVTGSGSFAWYTSGATNLTVNRGTSTINMTSASIKDFNSPGLTWGTINQGGSGQLQIKATGTFANITNTTQPAIIIFTSSTTYYFEQFSLSGTAGNLITLSATLSSPYTLSKIGGGVVSCNYLVIEKSTATGSGASWYAGANSTDLGGNTGWNFTAPPSGGMLFFFN